MGSAASGIARGVMSEVARDVLSEVALRVISGVARGVISDVAGDAVSEVAGDSVSEVAIADGARGVIERVAKAASRDESAANSELVHKSMRYLHWEMRQPGWIEQMRIPEEVTHICSISYLLRSAIVSDVGAFEFDRVPVIEWLAVKISDDECQSMSSVITKCPDLRYYRPLAERVERSRPSCVIEFAEPIWARLVNSGGCMHGEESPGSCRVKDCFSDRINRSFREFWQADISIGWVLAMAMMKYPVDYGPSLPDSRIAIAMVSEFSLIVSTHDRDVARMLSIRHAPLDIFTTANYVQVLQAAHTAIRGDRAHVLNFLLTKMRGADYLDICRKELIASLFVTAIKHESAVVIGMLLLKQANRISARGSARISPDMAQQCLCILMSKPKLRIVQIHAAIICGADPEPFHDRIFLHAMKHQTTFHRYLQSNMRPDPSRVNDLFWSQMRNPDENDRSSAVRRMWDWDQCAPHIEPAGIFAAVDQMPNHCHDKTLGSRWQLALRIDPEACCYITSRMDVAQTVIDLATIGQAELDAFLAMFPMVSCPKNEHNPTQPSAEGSHRLDISIDDNSIMVSIAFHSQLAQKNRTMSVIQSLIDASVRNTHPDSYSAYFLHDRVLLIVDSPVAASEKRDGIRILPAPIQYYSLSVIGIDLSTQQYYDSEQAMTACQACVPLNHLAWRKQQAIHEAEIVAMRSEIRRMPSSN